MNTDKKAPVDLDVKIGNLPDEDIISHMKKSLNILSNDKMDPLPPSRQATAVRRGTKTDGKVKIKSRRKSRRKSTVNKKLSKYQIKKLSRKRTSVKKTKK